MSDNNFSSNAREKTIFNDYRWAHPSTAAPLPGGKFPATLQWEIGNTGKILVKVNDGVFGQGDNQSYKKKQQEIELFERNAILELLRTAATDPAFTKAQYIIKRRQFVREGGGNGRMSENPITQASFTVIREESGLVKLGFTKSDFKALFEFNKISDSEMLEFKDGQFVPAVGLNSRIYVLGYIGSVMRFLDAKEHEKYTPKAPKNAGGGNGGGNRNNNSWGNGGGNNNRSGGNDFDDEMPDF